MENKNINLNNDENPIFKIVAFLIIIIGAIGATYFIYLKVEEHKAEKENKYTAQKNKEKPLKKAQNNLNKSKKHKEKSLENFLANGHQEIKKKTKQNKQKIKKEYEYTIHIVASTGRFSNKKFKPNFMKPYTNFKEPYQNTINIIDKIDYNTNVNNILHKNFGKKEYKGNISDIIYQKLSIPNEIRRTPVDEYATAEFNILKDGRFENIILTEKTNYSNLNKKILEAINYSEAHHGRVKRKVKIKIKFIFEILNREEYKIRFKNKT